MTVDVRGIYMKWNLTYLFESDEAFKIAYNEAQQLIININEFEGKLGNLEDFKKYYLIQKEFESKFSRVYQYASLSSDLNKKDVEKATLVSMCMILLNKFVQDIAFEEPELIQLGYEKVMSFVDKCPELEEFRFGFKKLFHQNEHILEKRVEQIISIYRPALSTAGELYSALAVADGIDSKVVLDSGEEKTVTQGNWPTLILESKSEAERQRIFETLYKKYETHKNTFAKIYETILKGNKANAVARGYNSVLESYLFGNNIPTKVYETLVETAGNNTKALKKYLNLRKEYLGLSKYHTYDRFMSLSSSNKKYSFEDAKELYFKSIEKFPNDFKEYAYETLKDGFVDVYEQPGKRTGAYSSSVTDNHPFILLNYADRLEDVFTVAHESGHSIHSLYAMNNQPAALQNYTIFVAEIASTFNEHNLLDYLMNSGTLSKEEKIVLLQKAIDNIYGTYYRQTLFAEFELLANKKCENNEPINHEVLSNIMIDLYKKYYDVDIEDEKVKKYVWAHIPHIYYTPFYVYQYATSFAASFKIYQDIKNNVPGAFDKYIGLLKSGGSKYPVDQAKEAGVDFTDPATFDAVTNRMNELVDMLEELLKEK